MRLLVVEDARRLRETLTDGLRAAGYAVDAVGDGRRGLIHARTTDYDAIVLDVMLPEVDGLTMLRELRQRGCVTPVLVLSARDRVDHRVEGLREGADDYLVKPFDFGELLARLEAICRRARGLASNRVRLGDLELDLAAKRFTAGGRDLPLAPRDYAVLELLVLNAGRVVTRAELEEHVYPEDKPVWSNSVDSAVVAIRRALAEAGLPPILRTRRGRGYIVEAAPEGDAAAGREQRP